MDYELEYKQKEIERLDLECKKQRMLLETIQVEEAIKQAKMLSSLGANFSPETLITKDLKSKLPKHIGDALTASMSDIRPNVQGYSTAAMLKEFRILVQTPEFNKYLIEMGILVENENGKEIHKDYEWYGYNKHSSSVSKYPVTICWYKDRFTDLVGLIRNEGYIN